MSKFAGLELEVDKPSRMIIMHPTKNSPLRDKDGKEAWIDIYSSDSQVAQKHGRAQTQRFLNTLSARTKPSAEEAEQNKLDLLSWLTADWYLVDLNGNAIDVPCSREAAFELYSSNKMIWLRDQVDAFAPTRAHFSPASSGS